MSAYHTGMVWLFSGATGNARLVLLALADHAAHDGSVTISQSHLAGLCNCAPETVRRAITDLIEAGEIAMHRDGGPTHYLILPPSKRGVSAPEADAHQPDTPQNEGGACGTEPQTPQNEGSEALRVGRAEEIATPEIQTKETNPEKNIGNVSGGTTPETQLAPVEIVTADVPAAAPAGHPDPWAFEVAPAHALPPIPATLPQTDVGHVLHALGVEADPAMPFYWFRADHAADLDAVAGIFGSTPRDLAALIRSKGLSCPQLRRVSDLVEVMKNG